MQEIAPSSQLQDTSGDGNISMYCILKLYLDVTAK